MPVFQPGAKVRTLFSSNEKAIVVSPEHQDPVLDRTFRVSSAESQTFAVTPVLPPAAEGQRATDHQRQVQSELATRVGASKLAV